MDKRLGQPISRRKLLAYLGAAGIGTSFLAACRNEPELHGTGNDVLSPAPDMGMVIERGAVNYERWRANLAWHSFVSERRPQLIVRPDTREQVVEAVRYAHDNDLTVSCKSGGHSYYETWMRQDALLLDMYNFRDVEVDPQAQTAWVGPSTWGSSLTQALRPHGLAFPVSTCLSVPMGGYIMGGGIGFGWQDWGMACHSVLAVEVVTADGAIITASADKHADLFWAARGGIAGFPGVVLRWKLRVYPDPGVMHITGSFYSVSQMNEMLSALQKVSLRNFPGWHAQVALLPTTMAKTVMLPPDKAATVNLQDSYICMLETFIHADTEAQTRQMRTELLAEPVFEQALASVENVGSGLISIYEDMKGREITHVNQICNAVWTAEPAEAMQRIAGLLEGNTADVAYAALLLNGRDMHREDAAFSMASRGYGSLSCYGLWFSDNEQGVADWQERVSAALSPVSEGRYINETDCFRHPELAEQSYRPESWKKLKRVNKQYDPNGLFHTFPGFKDA